MPAVFGRLVTAMATPFTPDLKVDYDRAGELALRLISQGSQGLVISGSTGESPTLSAEEKVQLFKVVKDAVGDKAKVIAGTGSYNTAESVHLIKQAETAGADAALCVVPYYNKPPQEGIYQHFKAIAEGTSLPLMLYNIPSRCVVNMLPETVLRLSEIPNIVAVKESSGDLGQISEIVRITPPDFDVYSGDDHLTLPVLAVGGVGIVSVASHLVGPRIAGMIEAFLSGKNGEAARIHLELMPLFKGLFFTANPVPLKAALKLLGFPVGGLRLPLPTATPKEEEQMASVLRTVGLLV